ncbi:DUF2752 domain-containing protein [Nocardioides marmorisolisilvae]|uniref:DUF2752 domain-containing protein n=1 Tax=Nocardioides marmorisolisilvae TaxID=1542737 RepID=A0A3N0E017_9ACTN|nr:DUF2752 domain-containing protein [Nocardioides marmorisolisilvae]RNL81150.1 DUF2752 domain-containing protein [Nocardioides marmorisolisilvae]
MSAPTRASVVWTATGVGAATLLVAAVNPNDQGHYPTCPLLALTGIYCPFCGGLRAVHDLAHLDIAGAFARNPVAALALPLIAVVWALWAQQAFTGRRLLRIQSKPWWGWAVVGFLAVFMVARNLPGAGWLSPA